MAWRVAMVCLVGTIVWVAGCAQDMVTRDHFNMIVEGRSTRLELEKTMGEKYIDRGNQWEYERPNKGLSVVFYFDDHDRVIRKEWIDARSGEWEGAAPHIDKDTSSPTMSEEAHTATIKEEN